MLTSRLNLFKIWSYSEKLCYSTCCLVRCKSIHVHPHYKLPSRLLRVNIAVYNSSDIKPSSSQVNNASIDINSEAEVNNDFLKGLNPEDIVGKDEAMLKKLKILLLEVDILRQDGFPIPDTITAERWKELLMSPSRSQRLKLLNFLFKIQKKRESFIKKKSEKKKEVQALQEVRKKERDMNPHIIYGFGGSTIFLRVYDTKIDGLLNQKLITAMQFGQKLVLDCSYDVHMTPKEASLCAKQMMYVFSENRKHDDPFDLYFCNALPDMKTMKKLHCLVPTLHDDDFPLNITSKSYLNLFPKEKLVYLTPHCREELTTYSHDDIYIIGGMVDKVSNEQLSLGIAKREGLRMAKLPLDRHLLWHLGSKSLTLNQVILILLEMKKSGDWSQAFRHVPKRKVLHETDQPFKATKGPSIYRQRLNKLINF